MYIFISYAKKDGRNFANVLYTALNGLEDISVWMDRDLTPGEAFSTEIQQELLKCDLMLVVLSLDVNRKKTSEQRRSFVLQEIDFLQANRPGTKIIPLLIDRAQIPIQLSGLEYIDFTSAPEKAWGQFAACIGYPNLMFPKVPFPKQNLSNETPDQPRESGCINVITRILVPLIVPIIAGIFLLISADRRPTPTPAATQFVALATASATSAATAPTMAATDPLSVTAPVVTSPAQPSISSATAAATAGVPTTSSPVIAASSTKPAVSSGIKIFIQADAYSFTIAVQSDKPDIKRVSLSNLTFKYPGSTKTFKSLFSTVIDPENAPTNACYRVIIPTRQNQNAPVPPPSRCEGQPTYRRNIIDTPADVFWQNANGAFAVIEVENSNDPPCQVGPGQPECEFSLP